MDAAPDRIVITRTPYHGTPQPLFAYHWRFEGHPDDGTRLSMSGHYVYATALAAADHARQLTSPNLPIQYDWTPEL